MEDLPEAVFLKGSDQRTVQALEANIPNLSRPEVQAYIVRCSKRKKNLWVDQKRGGRLNIDLGVV